MQNVQERPPGPPMPLAQPTLSRQLPPGMAVQMLPNAPHSIHPGRRAFENVLSGPPTQGPSMFMRPLRPFIRQPCPVLQPASRGMAPYSGEPHASLITNLPLGLPRAPGMPIQSTSVANAGQMNPPSGLKRRAQQNRKNAARHKKQKLPDGTVARFGLDHLQSQSARAPVEWELRQPNLRELRKQNKKSTRKHFPRRSKKKAIPLDVPEAPLNTTSFIMSADSKLKSSSPMPLGGSSAPPSPWPSNSAGDQVVDAAKEMKVDPYGSMNGCIRLRTSDDVGGADSGVGGGNSSSGESVTSTSSDSVGPAADGEDHADEPQAQHHHHASDGKEQHHHRQRLEMMYSGDLPSSGKRSGEPFLRARLEEQELQIAHLEEENLTLRERLYVAEQEVKDFKRQAADGVDVNAEAEGQWDGEGASAADADASASAGS
eukprot:TRINITY_DN738_c0_g2_i1.p1 TRINITY_DN738_c0_g2~~TRINITY_DN738_c0_g2_i1.p1  ORF type:complete len:430 (-),score=55.65 TRINITY_DN738_c0_g2_i1:769-2058(-)